MKTQTPALTLAQTRVLATVIKTTKNMLQLADQGEWGTVAELELLRREDLQFCFDMPADEDKAELVAEALAVLLHLNEELMDAAKKRLAELGKQLSIPEDRQFLEMGSTKLEIVATAEEQHVDLIVLGSHGRHGLALLLGSTANGVLHHAKCDVLAVRLKDN